MNALLFADRRIYEAKSKRRGGHKIAICVYWPALSSSSTQETAESIGIIASLGNGNPRLLQPIPCVARPVDDGFVASFSAAGMNASGESRAEAIENLKDIIAAKYRVFSSYEPNQLSVSVRRQLRVLQAYLED